MIVSWKSVKKHKGVVPSTEDEAVSLIFERRMSKHQDLLLKHEAKFRKADIYPAYDIFGEDERYIDTAASLPKYHFRFMMVYRITIKLFFLSCKPPYN